MEKETVLNVGFDDTDSLKGMCTTFLAYKIVDSLQKQNIEFLDFPRLIRFNPNIPWKTRGNGAVSFKIKTK
ncbi:MAG: DNA-binding protein, partial [Nitrosopumilus sp.]|nr:DNA-binding protein [Nitrosopumilus sp.]